MAKDQRGPWCDVLWCVAPDEVPKQLTGASGCLDSMRSSSAPDDLRKLTEQSVIGRFGSKAPIGACSPLGPRDKPEDDSCG
jgi:hypothetical protein